MRKQDKAIKPDASNMIKPMRRNDPIYIDKSKGVVSIDLHDHDSCIEYIFFIDRPEALPFSEKLMHEIFFSDTDWGGDK